MADKKKLIAIRDQTNFNMWRLGFENGGQMPADLVNNKFTNEKLAKKEAERLNKKRAEENTPKKQEQKKAKN